MTPERAKDLMGPVPLHRVRRELTDALDRYVASRHEDDGYVVAKLLVLYGGTFEHRPLPLPPSCGREAERLESALLRFEKVFGPRVVKGALQRVREEL